MGGTQHHYLFVELHEGRSLSSPSGFLSTVAGLGYWQCKGLGVKSILRLQVSLHLTSWHTTGLTRVTVSQLNEHQKNCYRFKCSINWKVEHQCEFWLSVNELTHIPSNRRNYIYNSHLSQSHFLCPLPKHTSFRKQMMATVKVTTAASLQLLFSVWVTH